jgi:hypothetical protein
VVKLVGYKVEDHLQKVFIEKFYDQKKIYEKKSLDNLLSICVIFFSLTTEKQ